MAELANRDELEANFAKHFGKLARRHMHEFRELLGNPPRIENVPEEFWNRMQAESNEELLPILLLLWSESADQHGWTGPSMSLAALGWSTVRANDLSRHWVESTKTRLSDGFEKLRKPEPEAEETIDEAMETNARLKPYEPREIDRDKLWDLIDQTFGPKRIDGVAVDETTRARHAGGEAAIEETVGISTEDIWKCDFRHSNVCEICSPLNDQPRSVWSLQFPEGPPEPHNHCQCFVEYANHPKKPSKKSFNPREARDDHGRWIEGGSNIGKLVAKGKHVIVAEPQVYHLNEDRAAKVVAAGDDLKNGSFFHIRTEPDEDDPSKVWHSVHVHRNGEEQELGSFESEHEAKEHLRQSVVEESRHHTIVSSMPRSGNRPELREIPTQFGKLVEPTWDSAEDENDRRAGLESSLSDIDFEREERIAKRQKP